VAQLADHAAVIRAQATPSAISRIEQRTDSVEKLRPSLATPDDLPEQLRLLAESYVSDEAVAAYLIDSGSALAPRHRLAFLQALSSMLPTDRVMHWYSRGVSWGLSALVGEWKRSAPIISWAREGIPSFIENNFVALIGRERQASSGLDHLFALPLGDDATTILLRAVASSLDEMSSHQLFAVAESLASLLADEEVRDSMLWSIERLECVARTALVGLPVTPEQTLAQFLFAIFGNIDKRKRWRAAHAARLLLRYGDQTLTDSLVGLTSARHADNFMSPSHSFYWLSARQWLMLVIARLSDESPDKLRPHLDLLADMALDTALPHASIREMAQRAALAVHAAISTGLSAERLQAVQLANQPRSCYLDRKQRYSRSQAGDGPELRFDFDSMDTLPYWYSPLADVFGVNTSEVSIRSEKWIVDHLGCTKEDTWEDRRELRRERQWQLMSNDHGTFPVLESLDIYLKYHGMLLTAGQLIDEGFSVGYDEWEEPGGSWCYWLSHHVESSPHWWLSDLRSPAPLEPYVYDEVGPIEEWQQVSPQDFERLLLVERAGEKRLVVHSYISTRSDDRHESLCVRTALVSPETSHALMRALQTTDANDFFLPSEGSGETSEGRREIHEGDFQLTGLLLEESVDRETIEERDPLARIRYSFNRPGEAFMKHAGARPNPPTGLQWRDGAGALIAEVTVWNDAHEDERDSHERQTNGTRATVSVEAMRLFLQSTERELIIDVEIDRKDDRRDESWDTQYEPAKARIYLLNKEGQLESMEGIRQL